MYLIRTKKLDLMSSPNDILTEKCLISPETLLSLQGMSCGVPPKRSKISCDLPNCLKRDDKVLSLVKYLEFRMYNLYKENGSHFIGRETKICFDK